MWDQNINCIKYQRKLLKSREKNKGSQSLRIKYLYTQSGTVGGESLYRAFVMCSFFASLGTLIGSMLLDE